MPPHLRTTHLLSSCLLFGVLLLSVPSFLSAASDELVGEFQHVHGSDLLQAGTPMTEAQCEGEDENADDETNASIGYFANNMLIIASESDDVFSVSPTHPSCRGVTQSWVKLPGNTLTRKCGTSQLTITSIEAETGDTPVSAGIVVTVMYEDNSFCSTHLSKVAEATSSASADWKTWVYSMIGVAISSVISLLGIVVLLFHRDLVQAHMTELLALSCGTFIGSVIFSLLPETAMELGMEVEITAVLFGGILFGMLSETVIHGSVEYFGKRLTAKAAANKAKEGEAGVELQPHSGGVQDSDASPRHAGETIVIHCAAACDDKDEIPALETCSVEQVVDVAPDDAGSTVGLDAASSKVDGSTLVASSVAVNTNDEPQLQPHHNHAHGEEGHNHADHHHNHHHHVRQRPEKKHSLSSHPHHHDVDEFTKESDAMHGHSHGAEMDARHAALINCVADALHNFIDGALIGATFLVSPSTGWTTTATIALHELPQEICDFALLMNAGLTGFQAAMVNLLTSLTAFLGAIIAIAIGEKFAYEVTNVLPFAAGLFLYLALAVLMPDIMRVSGRKAISVWISFSIGIALMAVQLALPWEHSHGDESSSSGGDAHAGHNHGRR